MSTTLRVNEASAKTLHFMLLAGSAFLALTAVPGGLMLLLGIYAPPETMLRGSLFSTFTIPGLALLCGVGGSGIVASVLLLRRSSKGVAAAMAAGVAVMIFEMVQVLTIGSPAGAARVMQGGYFVLGALLVAVGAVCTRRYGRAGG